MCPPPSSDLMIQSGELRTTDNDPSIAADVIRDNGKVLMYDRDRVSRFQHHWRMCQASGR